MRTALAGFATAPCRPASWSCTSASSPSPPRHGAPGSLRGCSRAPRPRHEHAARRLAFAFGWLPAGRPEPDAVPFYGAAGYTARPDIADFYAEGSIATGAVCPYCGAAAVPLRRAAVRQGPDAGLTPRSAAPAPQRSQPSGDQVRRFIAQSASSRHTKLSFCRSRKAIMSSSRLFMTNGP